MKPRLTKKVLRGLDQLAAGARASGLVHGPSTDIGAALTWITERVNWRRPTRRQQVPKHLVRALRRRKPRR